MQCFGRRLQAEILPVPMALRFATRVPASPKLARISPEYRVPIAEKQSFRQARFRLSRRVVSEGVPRMSRIWAIRHLPESIPDAVSADPCEFVEASLCRLRPYES